jgi:hypothetical protein
MVAMRRPLAILVSAGLLTACGFNHTDADRSSRPTRATGSAARVIMPGESPSTLEQAEQAPPSDEEVTMLGGGAPETDSSESVRDVPLGPLAVLFGYPFWIFGKTVEQKADQAAEERQTQNAEEKLKEQAAQKPRTGRDRAEQQRLSSENERLKEQLAQRAAAPQPARARMPSVREELAALERSLGKSAVAGATAPAPDGTQVAQAATSAPVRSLASAEGQGSRETLDENGDGKVDRVLHYDGQRVLTQLEEDVDHNGSLETVSLFEGGKVSRKRSDANGDGQPDSWSFYKAGDLVRSESDQNGDGFRDRIATYQNGELQREEEDRNADGQPDLLTHYKNGEISEKHEDVDYDGKLDMASYYEKGRLVRRELSSPDVLEQWTPQGGN